jgi:beta-galactosidase
VWQWVWPAVLGTALAVLLVVAMVQTFASPKTSAVACGNYQNSSDPTTSLSADAIFSDPKTKFPDGFVWGTATSSYQIEGAVKEDGRGPSIWDKFSHTKNKIANNENGDVACDHYHLYKDDIALMKELGVSAYRFSIAWPRIFPDASGTANPKGLEFYSTLVDEVIKAGLVPYVTLYHWDLPQWVQDSPDSSGWLKPGSNVTFYYVQYADVIFKTLGDRVKHWITFNEPWVTSWLGYGKGVHAPGIKSPGSGAYQVAHNQILAHVRAVDLYRNKYKEQGGVIGITLNSDFKQPASNRSGDVDAAQRAQLFQLAWFADPVFKGDYPDVMKDLAGDRLPRFTDEEKKLLKANRPDFFGLNHYTTQLVAKPAMTSGGTWEKDQQAQLSEDACWVQGQSGWLYNVPWGLRKLLNWIDDRYDGPAIVITENGASDPHDVKARDATEAYNDEYRQNFTMGYIAELWKAITFDKVNVTGYFLWSLMDNFEWADGYTPRFGLVYVDFKTLQRTPKGSFDKYKVLVKKYSSAAATKASTLRPLPPQEPGIQVPDPTDPAPKEGVPGAKDSIPGGPTEVEVGAGGP